MKAWYYAIGREQNGPVSRDELVDLAESGALRPDDLVWVEGMSEWKPSGSIPELSRLQKEPKAPEPKAPAGPPPYPMQPTSSAEALAANGSSAPSSAPTPGDDLPSTDVPSADILGAAESGANVSSADVSDNAVSDPPVPIATAPSSLQFAGFGHRAGAILIDSVLVLVASAIFGGMLGVGMAIMGVGFSSEIEAFLNVVSVLAVWLYFAGMESSKYQATFGKRLLGLKVTDLNGRPVGFGKATGRHFGKVISGLTFLIGYLIAAFTEKKQALHDLMAGCLVVRDEN